MAFETVVLHKVTAVSLELYQMIFFYKYVLLNNHRSNIEYLFSIFSFITFNILFIFVKI